MAFARRWAGSRGAPAGVAMVRAWRSGDRRATCRASRCVDVADAGGDPLIQQRHFQRDLLGPAGAGQRHRVERLGQRLAPEFAQHRVRGQLRVGQQVHQPEAPRIVEGDHVTRVQVEDDVIVRIGADDLAIAFGADPGHALDAEGS